MIKFLECFRWLWTLQIGPLSSRSSQLTCWLFGPKAADPVPFQCIIVFNFISVALALPQAFCSNNLPITGIVVGINLPRSPNANVLTQLSQGLRTTITTLPPQEFFGVMIKHFPDPEKLFFLQRLMMHFINFYLFSFGLLLWKLCILVIKLMYPAHYALRRDIYNLPRQFIDRFIDRPEK